MWRTNSGIAVIARALQYGRKDYRPLKKAISAEAQCEKFEGYVGRRAGVCV